MSARDDFWGEPIHVYTRAQAIEDGVLVDLTEWASASRGFHGGFTCPVAVTAAVWAMVEAIPDSQTHQDVRGRAHDLLWMASLAVRGMARRRLLLGAFSVLMHVRGTRTRKHTFRIALGVGDDGQPCVTIMLPDED